MPKQKMLWNETDEDEHEFDGISSIVRDVFDNYKALANDIPIIEHSTQVSYDSPVNFKASMSSPRHRWFAYKEGFSPSFVRGFLNFHKIPEKCTVLDPFGGVGTTVLETGMRGGAGVAMEVSPLAAFIARTKATNFSSNDVDLFHSAIESFAEAPLVSKEKKPANSTVVSYFDPDFLDAILKVKAFYSSCDNYLISSLIKMALLSNIERFSTHRKAGNGLKRKTRLSYNKDKPAIEQVRAAILDLLKTYLEDINQVPLCGDVEIMNESSLELDSVLPEKHFDCMLTSPPYANCFDYSKIYMCELWLGDYFCSPTDQVIFRANSVRSHVHARWEERFDHFGSPVIDNLICPALSEQQLWSKYIPGMLQGYFNDLGRMLSGLMSVMKPGAPIGMVVSNSVYGGIPIATDLLLADIAKRLGFIIERIEVYRHIIPSSQQFNQLSNKQYFRESMVVFKCP